MGRAETSALREALAPFVPQLILRRFASNPARVNAPEIDCFPAAALFADLSGFTALTERHAQRGPAGVEELTGLLNRCFEALIGVVLDHGGDVVKLAGDALTSLWTAEPGEPDLAAAVNRAAQCGLAMHASLGAGGPAAGMGLSMRAGIGAGEVVTMHLGGVFDRWELLLGGEAVRQ